MFFVMAKDPRYHSMAVYEVNVCELILYSIGTIAVIAGGWKMRLLQFRTASRSEYDKIQNKIFHQMIDTSSFQ